MDETINEIPMTVEMKILSENGVGYKTGEELEQAIIKSLHDYHTYVLKEVNGNS